MAIAALAGGGSTSAPVRPPGFDLPPGSLSVATFVNWPAIDQFDYVEANGTGTPRQVTIGPPGTTQITATNLARGMPVDILYIPPNFGLAPSVLTATEFLDWGPDQQRAYVRANGAGSPLAVTIGAGTTPQIRASLSAVTGDAAVTFLAPAISPSALASTTFLSWLPGHQLAYVTANAAGTPASVLIGTPSGAKLLATLDAAAQSIGLLSLPVDFDKAPITLSAKTFLQWSAVEQRAYVDARGTGSPKSVAIGPPGQPTVTATAAGSGGVTLALAVPSTAPGVLTTATFLSWHPAHQLVYADANGIGDPKTVAIGAGHPKILASSPTGATVVEILTPPAEFATAPASLPMQTFLQWTPRLQLVYTEVWGTGSPKSVTLGTAGQPTLTATMNAPRTAVGIGYTAPTTAPASLSTATFLGWADGVRLAYVNAQGTGTPKTVTIGLASERALTATVNAAGTGLVYDSYWAAQAQRPPNPVIDAVPVRAIPYHFLAGSDVGIESAVNNTVAEQVFPTLDGATNKLPGLPPPANGIAYTANEFLSFHSAYQLEIVKSLGSDTAALSDGTKRKQMTFGTGTNSVTAVVATDGKRLFVIEHLQKRDFSIMSKLDQEAVTRTTAFSTLATRLQLTTDRNLILNGNGVSGDPAQLGIQGTINDINSVFNARPAGGLMSAADKDAFVQQLENLKLRVNDFMAVFSSTDIMKQVGDIANRFRRAYEFAHVANEGGSNPQFVRICSLDGKAVINQGYRKFIEQEKQLLALDNARLDVARTGVTQNKKLDAPNLVFLLQLQYNLTAEAKVTVETEEVNQQNALLKTYAEIQRLINNTVKLFDTSDAKQKKGLNGNDNVNIPAFASVTEAKAVAMFEDALASGGNLAQHPLEKLRGITRPTQDMYHNSDNKYNIFLKNEWDTFNTQLSDTVTLINQESQIKMNDINSMDKQKNRHFDLANSALQKMNEIIQNIARSAGN